MSEIKRLIDYNIEKTMYLKRYLDANRVIEDMLMAGQLSGLDEVVDKKRAIGRSIDVIDDKIIGAIAALKQSVGIDDLSQLDTSRHGDAAQLKIESGKVLHLMVDLKNSDRALLEKIDAQFAKYKNSTARIDRNKLYSYTNKRFAEG